jgi:hypothetical protein
MISANQPKAAHGSRRVVEVCCVAWIDLLGYGSMLRQANFDPTDPRTETAIERLGAFHTDVARHSSKYSPSIVMNDGAAFYRDLSPRTGEVTYDFLERIFRLHQEINERELASGFPGARAIVATGFRIRRMRRRQRELTDGIGRYLTRAAESGRIPIKEAVYKAVTIKPFFDVIPELQANFAFTKAYLADSDGSRAGFIGPRYFVERCMFGNPLPLWLNISEEIAWQTPGMVTTFAAVLQIDQQAAAKSRYRGVRDAFEIAETITGSQAVVERLRALRIRRRVLPTNS